MKKTLLFFALLCAFAQGALAQNFDVWDGVTMTQPGYVINSRWSITYQINTAAEMAWLMNKYNTGISVYIAQDDRWMWCRPRLEDIDINADLDMTAANWITLTGTTDNNSGYYGYDGSLHYDVTLNGKGHTVKIKIDNGTSSDNYQGLFYGIGENAKVENLHVDCNIKVGNARLVGGICGENRGTIENCWVSGHVESSHYSAYDADLGGIAGLNKSGGKIKYCCVTADIKNTGGNSGVGGIAGSNEGTIQHVTFYGDVSVNHAQDNKWVGDQDGTLSNNYDSFNQGEYDDASGKDLYRRVIKYPYAINVTTVGQGSLIVSAGGENNVPGASYNQEVTLTTSSGSTAEVTVTDADGNNVTLFGSSGSGFSFIMPKRDVNVHAVFSVPDWPRQGSGTANYPYLITSADDWNEFALSVNAGNTHSGEYVKLTSNISTWMMAGASETNSFQGTFDGNGHTLTVSYNTSAAVTAPFRYTNDATISDLSVAGTISTIAMQAAGIVAQANGSLDLTNCRSSVTINSSRDNSPACHGGLVGWVAEGGSATISGCVFDGALVSVEGTGKDTECGGFVAMSEGTTTITNSLLNPSSVSNGMVSGAFIGASLSNTITNCYYVAVENLPTNQGTQAINAAPWNIGNLTQNYGMVKAYEHGIIYNGSCYVDAVQATAETGTENDPYTINSTDRWNDFVNIVNGGFSFSGKFVKLTSNISVSNMAGTDDANSFRGTFDGDGNTLTVSYNTSENWTAPFRHVKDATIKNLHVDGTINTSAQFAGGIVGESHKDLNITNCRSSVAINSSVSGDGTHGGLVSTLSGSGNTIIIDGCVFDGSFATTANTTNCGGFVGWPVYNRPTIKNSLMIPSSVSAGMLNNTFARWHTTYEPTITNCFFFATSNLPTDQGAPTVTDAEILPAGEPVEYNVSGITAYVNGISYGGNFYYNPDRNIKREIAGYGEGSGNWAFIASPVEGSIEPTEVNNLIGTQIQTTPSVLYDYDLFRLDDEQWENYVQHTGDFNIVNGNGYLYATQTTKNLVFSGIFNTENSKTVALSEGFNLVGNPFAVNAYVSKPFYQMNAEGTDIVAVENYDSYTPVAIPPCTGIVVRASGADAVTFSTSAPQQQNANNNGNLQMTLTKAGVRNDAFQDKAIVSFNQGSQLEKFVFNERHAKLYIPQYGEDYAIAFSDMSGEVPLNFKATETGRYTIGFNFENVKGVRIQLIDKIEDKIIDLNKDVSGNVSTYTFMGSTIDRSDRFTLVFTQVETDGVFAYQSGNDIIVSGNGELQVFDVMGRMVMNQYINGVQTVEKPSTTGVYIFRLNEKTQKIVVK